MGQTEIGKTHPLSERHGRALVGRNKRDDVLHGEIDGQQLGVEVYETAVVEADAAVRLTAGCLLPSDSYTSAAAAAAEAPGCSAGLAEPAREAVAAYVDAHHTAHRPDARASPHPVLRRAHQHAVLALAHLGDVRALPELLTALDTGTDAWRAVNAAGHLPQAATLL
ncbi:hypothetical protein [Streptomyces sp. NPDC058622]|uniref:hypothetical protein n=1 Tax=unclassified Streptomyces TaxID=2593676 RepID=UPI003654260F